MAMGMESEEKCSNTFVFYSYREMTIVLFAGIKLIDPFLEKTDAVVSVLAEESIFC